MVDAKEREQRDEVVLALTPVQLAVVAVLIVLAIMWRRLGTQRT